MDLLRLWPPIVGVMVSVCCTLKRDSLSVHFIVFNDQTTIDLQTENSNSSEDLYQLMCGCHQQCMEDRLSFEEIEQIVEDLEKFGAVKKRVSHCPF